MDETDRTSASRGMTDDFTKMRRQRGFMATVARGLGISEQSVARWKLVPIERVFSVARLLRVPPETLRPDFFSEDPLRRLQMTDRRFAWAAGQKAEALERRRAAGVINGKKTPRPTSD